MIKKLDNDSIDRLVFAWKHMVQINIFVLSHKKQSRSSEGYGI